MNDNFLRNNKVFLSGEVVEEPVYSHELYGEGFYEFYLSVARLSGQADILPVTVSERLMTDVSLLIGEKIALSGQFRSYNKLENERSKLMLTIFVRDFLPYDEYEQNPNNAELNGYICKPPVYRKTPLGREIADLLLAVNRPYGKSDYIPCICWGRNARFANGFEVGDKCCVWGRIQSREYMKKLDEEHMERRVAYEVSVSKLEVAKETAE